MVIGAVSLHEQDSPVNNASLCPTLPRAWSIEIQGRAPPSEHLPVAVVKGSWSIRASFLSHYGTAPLDGELE